MWSSRQWIYLSIFIGVLGLGIFLYNLEFLQKSKAPAHRELASVQNISIDSYIDRIPVTSWRNGLKKYIQMLGLKKYDAYNDLGNTNVGLATYNTELLKQSKCFQVLKERFYDKIISGGARYNLNGATLANKLNITTKDVGDKSGWLWDLAMQTSNNNPNLAMTLIGMCGHDDTGQILGHGNSNRAFICPSASSRMFIQGALGEETLLNPRLIDRIQKTQAPNKEEDFLPAKYYHVMGSAYMTCTLVQEGLPSAMVRKISEISINTYRMQRLCEEKKVFMKKTNLKKLAHQITNGSYDKCLEQFLGDDGLPNTCSQLIGYALNMSDKDRAKDLVLKKLNVIYARSNANKILSHYVTDKKNCSNPVLIGGPMAKLDAVSRRFTNFCSDLSKEECHEAKKVLRTYLIDFKWSEAQHMKGVDFAINNCKKQPGFMESGLEEDACKVLGNSPKGSTSTRPLRQDSEGVE